MIAALRVLLIALGPAARRARWLAIAAAIALPPGMCAEGFGGTPSFDPLYPKPPYLQTNVDEYVVTVYEADRDAIQALLPAGIRPAVSDTVGISHYVVRQGAGLAPYEASYIFAEVWRASTTPPAASAAGSSTGCIRRMGRQRPCVRCSASRRGWAPPRWSKSESGRQDESEHWAEVRAVP